MNTTEQNMDATRDLLNAERLRLEQELKKTIIAVGLFRRVDSGGFLTKLVGSLIGIGIAVVLILVASLISVALGAEGGTGILGLLILALSIGTGWSIAAKMFRKAKEIPDDFGVVITEENVYFHQWLFKTDTKTVTLGPLLAVWQRAALSVATGDIEMRPAGIPAAATVPTTYAGIGFLLNNEPIFQAQVLSIEAESESGGITVNYGTEHNAVFELLKREHNETVINSSQKSQIERMIENLKNENAFIRREAHDSLRKLSGVDFGQDQQQWRSWWERKRPQ